MKIFVCHRASDATNVRQIISKWNTPSSGIQFLQVINKKIRWKKEVKKLLKNADMVIYFMGADISDNIKWEIKVATKLNKEVRLYSMRENCVAEASFYSIDPYTNEKIWKFKFFKPDELNACFKFDQEELEESLFDNHNINEQILLEQYKLILNTTETLTDRRQKLTTTYLTISSVTTPVVSAFIFAPQNFLKLSAAVLCILSILLCLTWTNAISSYGKVNSAKFDIINLLEKKLSASVFGSEWFALSSKTTKYVSFTSREKTVPIIFLVIHIVLFVISIIMFFMG